MKRVCLAVIATALFALCAQRHALAMYEFCPAELGYNAVGAGSSETKSPAALYGFDLSALGPRTVTSATLAFDTSVGWYTVNVPSVVLAEKDRHYTTDSSSFIRHDYVSPVMYVRFPASVTITHAWVYHAAAVNDALFGWQTEGNVECDPPAGASAEQQHLPAGNNPIKLDPKDKDDLSAPPQPTSTVLAPSASSALEKTGCADPFAYATPKNMAEPDFPSELVGSFYGRAIVTIRVAIDADGKVRDAWTWSPSGIADFDDSALRAAKLTTYSAARGYCQAVSGSYLFRVTFSNP